MDKEKRLHEILDLVQEKQIDTLTAKRDILILSAKYMVCGDQLNSTKL